MCFSATASFSSGIALMLIGTVTVQSSNVRTHVLFGCIPLLLAVQQFSEGVVWLALSDPVFEYWKIPATFLFLFFAQVLWPVWIPLSIFLLEKDRNRKKILAALLIVGAGVSAYLAYRLFVKHIFAEIIGHHIYYHIGVVNFSLHLSALLYFLATVVPALVSSVKKMWIFGIAIGTSYIIANLIYERYVLSVWCFFAALVSIIVFVILFRLDKTVLFDVNLKRQDVSSSSLF
ncbi:hypothetical protein SAMN04487898_109193 [Pedobacter sp. ok626]|uniref:DUF6629 family protein n=1 Tax=Pedobacter sp. ok626 TaxID=1761882 RepID=UPI00088BDA1B|nr:DUF6629 family protein [Pedobacter sp. ok626]SDK58342.1 hypothetical protein SAMN04487898_109193 [Pedobacter sp. ok626]